MNEANRPSRETAAVQTQARQTVDSVAPNPPRGMFAEIAANFFPEPIKEPDDDETRGRGNRKEGARPFAQRRYNTISG